MGKAVELSADVIYKVKHSDEKLQYKWSVDDEEIKNDDRRYELKESGVLAIQEFEKKLTDSTSVSFPQPNSLYLLKYNFN